MPKRSRPSIPQELLEIKAQQIYEQRLPKNKNGSPEGDWETARRYLAKYPKNVRVWKLWKCTGIGEKKGWDWVQLLISASIPFVIVFGTQYFNRQQQKIATARYQQEALTKYFEQMSQLLLDKKLREERSEARTIARARTLSTLRELDDFRKGLLIKFLAEAQLVFRENPVISLVDADFSDAQLSGVHLSGAQLSGVHLSDAQLSGADLFNADLSSADLSSSHLSDAHLILVNLSSADLSSADLSSANLFDANLFDANLFGANLFDANLTGAKLNNVKNLSNKQIKSACFWDKAIYTDTVWNKTERKWIAKDEKANRKRIEEIRKDKTSDSESPPDCNRWK